MSPKEKAEQRNAKFLQELNELNNITKKTQREKKAKSDFNNLKVCYFFNRARA